ncbi:unnamed protein product, partial [Durusdinium trenchii]
IDVEGTTRTQKVCGPSVPAAFKVIVLQVSTISMEASMEVDLKATEWDRETLMHARWLTGCQELKEGKVRKSIIRQIWLPDEWLAEEEPEPPARQSKELRSSRAPPPPA